MLSMMLDASQAAGLAAGVAPGIDWSQFGEVITAVGALGVAAFGATEALGKAFSFQLWRGHVFGLAYGGYGAVRHMVRPLEPALKLAYGDDYLLILAQQYRADRSVGRAPDTVRQGVRLGLPFMQSAAAVKLISGVWDMKPEQSLQLAQALQASPPADVAPSTAAGPQSAGAQDALQALAGRFSTALDARVNAAFAVADERYEAYAKLASAAVAVGLAFVFDLAIKPHPLGLASALLVGLVAVPLAPVAKDLSSSLQNALTAFKSIPTKGV